VAGKQAKRLTSELTHLSTSQCAAVLGVSPPTLRSWTSTETFPKKDSRGNFCVRDVVYWYLLNRADKQVQRESFEMLAFRLDVKLPGQESADPPSGAADESLKDPVFKTPMERLEYQTKLAKFEREMGDVVRIHHVENMLGRMFRKVREMLESISRETGRPVGRGMEGIVTDTMEELSSMKSGVSGDNDLR
jgi:hypothetical protein